MLTVVNMRDPAIKAGVRSGDPRIAYCGRADRFRKLRASPFANPFVIGKDGTRDEVVDRFRMWLWSQPELLAKLIALFELGVEMLACWCAPEACHCDVLKEVYEAQHHARS